MPSAAVPGSTVQAVMRTDANEPRSTMSHPDTVSPSSESTASSAPVRIQLPAAAGRITGRIPGPARTRSDTTGPGSDTVV